MAAGRRWRFGDADLDRKYRQELRANEIVLLAYYIAAIYIKEVFHGRMGSGSAYELFGGIVLTDTFNLYTEPHRLGVREARWLEVVGAIWLLALAGWRR